jgi:glycosyltransferase involved in cell wall biosynthesis
MAVKVSVGIAVYNVQQYIEKCVRSLFEQTLQEVEFVFVDDCSQDDSIKVLQKTLLEYPQRQNQVKIVSHLTNQGPMRARKSAMAEFTGEYMIFCDSDDWIEPDMLEKMYEMAEKSGADVIHCGYNIRSENKKDKLNCEAFDISDYQTFMKMFHQADISPFLWVFLFKRSCFDWRDFYLPDSLFFAEDMLLLFLRLVKLYMKEQWQSGIKLIYKKVGMTVQMPLKLYVLME